MSLTATEIGLILEALREKYRRGYSSVPGIGGLQAKLSVMLEVATKLEAKEKEQ